MPRDVKGKPVRTGGDETIKAAGGLADMKRSKAEKTGETKAMNPSSGPDYPYGLQIHLDHEGLKKVGITDLPTVGNEVHITAKAHVSAARAEQREDGEERRHLELQITHLGIHHKADNMKGEDQGGKARAPNAGHVTQKGAASPARKRH